MLELSEEVLRISSEIRFNHPEQESFVERIFRFMKSAHFRAQDFTSILAWATAFLPSRLLPSAWGGVIPSITLGGRHLLINEYMAGNPWYSLPEDSKLLDMGCGFPPFTAGELAAHFPHSQVVGADPAFAPEIVYDAEGNYACFYGSESLPRYFQVGSNEAINWQQLFEDPDATKQKFSELHNRLLRLLPGDSDPNTTVVVEESFGKLVRNPLRQYESQRLSFLQAGFFEFELKELDLIRCFNVLLYYDASYRKAVLEWATPMLRENAIFICGTDWVASTQARYTVYQKSVEQLEEREFAFSLDNLRPLGIVTWYALHNDDYGSLRMVPTNSHNKTHP